MKRCLLMVGWYAVMLLACGSAAAGQPPCGDFSAAITDCADVSPRTDSFDANIFHSVSGRMLSLTVSADGQRLYAGSFSGLWRSDDAGVSWRQLTRPQRPPQSSPILDIAPGALGRTDVFAGALRVPNVFDVVVSPVDKTGNVVLVATGDDTRTPANKENGIYRSSNGGNYWNFVHEFNCPNSDGNVGQIAFAPDNPLLVYAAGGCAVAISRDGGLTWIDQPLPSGGTAWHIAVAPREGSSLSGFLSGGAIILPNPPLRRVYAAGDNKIWYSQDGGITWREDLSSMLPSGFGFGGFPVSGGGNSARVLAVEPGHPDHVYLVVPGLANGPSYYQPSDGGPDGIQLCNTGPRHCDEGSLWLGDYSTFSPSQAAIWTQQPGPPTYFGVSTDSGNVYVITKTTGTGYLLFFSDRSHVHVSAGRPSALGWHRLDGRDASQGWCEGCSGNGASCNELFLHVDPHAFAVSSDFDMTLTAPTCMVGPASVPTRSPYNKNSVLDKSAAGRMWMANDGGVYYSDRKFDMDGGFEWKLGSGLVTLQPQSSFAGVSLPGKAAALYFGVPDDDNFFSPDGGNTWFDPQTQCGDCGAWFSDPAQPTRVLEFGRRDQGGAGGAWYLWVNARGAYPDPARDGTPARPLPEPFFDYNVAALKGYKPIILTLSNENLSDDGDYILIRRIPTTIKEFHGIMRTTQLSKISDPADWNTKASLVMPVFLDGMQNADIVQASGGHKNTVFYVGDTQSLWRLNSGSKQWQPIVPAKDGTANSASRFFVDPYNPTLIYIIDKDGIKRSDNAGDTWILDKSLDNLVTDGKSFSYDITPLPIFSEGAVITDMVFDRFERSTRFAVGNAGVFFTLDGQNWKQLLSTTAVPGHPVAGYFDNLNRAFYVAMNGRGILQLSPIPKFSQICGIACLIGP